MVRQRAILSAFILLGLFAAPLSAQRPPRTTANQAPLPATLPTWNSPPEWIRDAPPIFDESAARQNTSINHASSYPAQNDQQSHAVRPPSFQSRRNPLSAASHGTQVGPPRAVANASLMPGQVPLAEVTRPSAWAIQLGRSDSASAAILDPNVEPSFYQDPRARGPATSLNPLTRQPLSQRAGSAFRSLARTSTGRSLLSERRDSRIRRTSHTSDLISGRESRLRATTDVANLLGKSRRSRNIATQKRNPIVNDPRVRGTRTGQLVASGSHWVPARVDLDTVLSKLDSQIVEQVNVIKGPYSALHGPGFNFIDVELLHSPRSIHGPVSNGMTVLEYRHNGEQWYGRQQFEIASDDYGLVGSYGHRTGSDYKIGGGDETIPSSYKSRDLYLAFGADLSETSSVEMNYLRLDQTGVELAGQALNIDVLTTDAFDIRLDSVEGDFYDRAFVESWINLTEFQGSLSQPNARRFFPFLLQIVPGASTDFIRTDVYSLSTGYRAGLSWDTGPGSELTVGTDLRFIQQDLAERAALSAGPLTVNLSSPIPKAAQTNPGLFMELSSEQSDRTRLHAGLRVDWVFSNLLAPGNTLVNILPPFGNTTLAGFLDSPNLDPDDALWSAFVTSETDLGCGLTGFLGLAIAQRPPTLTELYTSGPFLFLLQNGVNTLVGNPSLKSSRAWQVDLGLSLERPQYRGSINGFFALVEDYITYDSRSVLLDATRFQQVLTPVNSDLVAMGGVEVQGEVDLADTVTGFGSLAWTAARDLRRDDGRQTQATPVAPTNAASLPTAGDEEPLPSISPLETRIGIRFHEAAANPRYGAELSVRIVAAQNQVATSLFEQRTSGFATVDFRSSWQATDSITVVSGVENLFDKRYSEHLDFNPTVGGTRVRRPGRSLYSSVEVRY